MTETFKNIPGCGDRYSCYDDGRIYSFYRKRFLNFTLNEDGYFKTTLIVNGIKKYLVVHRVIAMTFIGPCPDGMVVNHKNGIRTDNNVSNLEYLTPADNERHARSVLGKKLLGEKASRSKIKKETVLEIRNMRTTTGKTYLEISKYFKLSSAQI